jgi:SMI1-KNR4 cell-wall
MTMDELLAALDDKSPPAPTAALERFEAKIGHQLPEDYRAFLIRCNGGYGCGYIEYLEPTLEEQVAVACLNHVGGFREESYYSLESNHKVYQLHEVRIPKELIWIADDPFGNAICLGISGVHRGKIFFWDHENEPNPEQWDGRVETAGNIELVASSFSEFMAGLQNVPR